MLHARRLLLATAALLFVTPAAASAKFAATASVATDGAGVRLVVVLTSDTAATGRKAPKSMVATIKGKTVPLKRVAGSATSATALGTWRTAIRTGSKAAAVRSLLGKRVQLSIKTAAGTKRVKTSAAAAGGTGGAGGTGAGGTGSTPLFTPLPSSNLTGTPAFNAISGFVANSTITDCPTGWPACGGFERRFGIWSNNAFYDCNLRPTSGSDVLFSATIIQTTGANFNTDGSWAISFIVQTATPSLFAYRFDVAGNGAAVARWWSSDRNPSVDPANETINGLQWMRGAKTCQI